MSSSLGLDDWRGERLAEVRALVHEALPGVVETWKWMGSRVWEQHGIVLVGNAHQAKVKLTFPRGAQLTDPDSLFNAGLTGGACRAIDLPKQDTLDAAAFRALARAARGPQRLTRATADRRSGRRREFGQVAGCTA